MGLRIASFARGRPTTHHISNNVTSAHESMTVRNQALMERAAIETARRAIGPSAARFNPKLLIPRVFVF
jgi:hypothetical protein